MPRPLSSWSIGPPQLHLTSVPPFIDEGTFMKDTRVLFLLLLLFDHVCLSMERQAQDSFGHTWYLSFFLHNVIWGQEILHLKVRKFATKLAPGDTFWKFLFFIESGLKLIEFKFNSKQNPEYSFKKYSFNRVQYSIELFTQKNWGKLFKILK